MYALVTAVSRTFSSCCMAKQGSTRYCAGPPGASTRTWRPCGRWRRVTTTMTRLSFLGLMTYPWGKARARCSLYGLWSRLGLQGRVGGTYAKQRTVGSMVEGNRRECDSRLSESWRALEGPPVFPYMLGYCSWERSVCEGSQIQKNGFRWLLL